MTTIRRRLSLLVGIALSLAGEVRATQLIMPVNTNYNLDGGPIDISYFKAANCAPATGILNGTDFADGQNQGSSTSWETQTYTYARTASYQGGGGFQWFNTYPNDHITWLLKTAPPEVNYYKVRAIAFNPAFPCSPGNPPYPGDTSMTIEFEELPVFKNGFELSDLEDWAFSTHPL